MEEGGVPPGTSGAGIALGGVNRVAAGLPAVCVSAGKA